MYLFYHVIRMCITILLNRRPKLTSRLDRTSQRFCSDLYRAGFGSKTGIRMARIRLTGPNTGPEHAPECKCKKTVRSRGTYLYYSSWSGVRLNTEDAVIKKIIIIIVMSWYTLHDVWKFINLDHESRAPPPPRPDTRTSLPVRNARPGAAKLSGVYPSCTANR